MKSYIQRKIAAKMGESPSVWRVWIEISATCLGFFVRLVTLRVEGVD